MQRPRSTTIVGSVAVVAVAVAAMAYMLIPARRDRSAVAQTKVDAAGQSRATESAAPVSVEVTSPERRTLVRELALPASLEANESADLYAKTSGYVAEVRVDIGSRVRAGDLLVRIDVPEMHDELRQAEAVVAAKRANLEALKAKAVRAALMVETAAAEESARVADLELQTVTTRRKAELFKGNAIPQQEHDEALSRLTVAQAQVNIAAAKRVAAGGEKSAAEADVQVGESEIAVAESNVARLRTLMQYAAITAAFDGVITKRMIDPGDFVRSAAQGATMPLLTLASIDRLRLVLDIPESDCRYVRRGTELDVRLGALAAQALSCEVARTAHALNPATRTMRAEADLPNSDGLLSPGMYAQVAVKLESKQNALLVPSAAIRVRGREAFVLVAAGGVAKAVPVKIGYDDGASAEIVAGLDGDEAVITSSQGVIAAGTPVQASPAKRGNAAIAEAKAS